MGILCDVYDQLPRDIQYKVVLASLIIKLNNILSSGERPTEKLKKAKDLAEKIYSRFHEKEIENIVKSLDIQLRLSSLVDQAVESLNQAINLQDVDQAFSKLEETSNRIKVFFEPETRKYTSQYLSEDQMRFFESFVSDVEKLLHSGFKEAVKDLSNVMNETRSLINDFQNAKAGSLEESISLWSTLRNRSMDQLNKIRDIENRLKNIASSLNLSVLSGFQKSLEQVLGNINNIKITLNDLYVFSSRVNDVYSSLKSFVDLVRSMGSEDRYLVNDNFRRSLVDALTIHLQTVNRLNTADLSNKDLSNSLKVFANNMIEALRNYKQELVDSDPRWLDVFGEAEKKVGISLPAEFRFSPQFIDVLKKASDQLPEPIRSAVKAFIDSLASLSSTDAFKQFVSIIQSFGSAIDLPITKFTNDLRERAIMNLNNRSSSAIDPSKLYGGVLMFITGLIDTVSLIVRPVTAFNLMTSNLEMLIGGLKNIQQKGLQGLWEDLTFLGNQLCGSPERCIYFAGSLAGAVLLSSVVFRIPIPATLRGVVTDLALGDPVSPFIRVIVAERPITLLRNVVVTRAGEIVETSKVFNASEYVNKLREFLVQKVARFSDQVERSVKALEDNIKTIMKSKGSLEASMSDIKQGVLRYGIDNLRDLALKYIDFVDTYVKPFTAMDLVKTFQSLVESIYIKSVKIPEKIIRLKTDLFKEIAMKIPAVKPVMSLEVLKDLLERMRLIREAFAKAKTLMPSEVQKIRMPETLVIKIGASLADLRNLYKVLGSVELRRIISATETIKDMTSKARDALRFVKIFSENLPESLRKTFVERVKEIHVSVAKLEFLANKISESLKKLEERVREVKKLEEAGKIKPEEAFTRIRETFTGFTEDLEKIVREHPDLQKLIDINKIREEIPNVKNIDDLRALVNKEILSKLRGYITSESMLIIKRFGELLDALSKDPQVALRFKSFIETLVSNVNEMVRVELPRSFVIVLSPKSLELLKEVSKKILPFIELRESIKLREIYNVLEKAFFEGRLTLSEFEKITDVIAEEKPIKAGRVEVQAIRDALKSILEDVKKGIEKIPPEIRQYLVEAVRNVEGKIYEVERILFLETEMTKMKVIEGLSSTIRKESETVLSLLKEVSPTLEEKLRTTLDKLSREISAGKVSDETIKEVMNTLREASKVLKDAGIMPGMLKRALIRFVDLLNNNVSDDVRLAKLLSPIADEIIRILNTIPEIEGWGFVSLDISTSRAGMLMAPPEIRQWIREEIAKGRTVKEFKIGDVDIKLYKNIVLDPKTNTFTIEYRLIYPEGREAVIGLSTRITDGYVHRTFYSSMDPVLVQAYKDYASGNVKSSLYKIGESLDELYKDSQRFMKMIDPDFDKWKNIAVYGSSSGMIKIGDILNASLTGLVNILSTARMEAKPPEKLTTEDQLFLASASAPKDALINATRPLITATPEVIAQEVVSKGYSPVGYVNPKIFITEYIAPAIEKLMKTNDDIRRRILGFFNNPNILKQLGISFSDIMKSIGVEGFLKNIFNALPVTTLIDLVDKMRSAIPEIQDLIKKITWALDNIIVYAVPTQKPFIPSKEEWTIIKIGDLTIPVPIIGRFMGRRVTIVPIMTERIAQEFQTKIAPVQTQERVQLPLLTIQYITPESAIQVPTSTEIPVAGMPLTIVSLFGVAPSLGPLAGGERRGVGRGVQREVLTVL